MNSYIDMLKTKYNMSNADYLTLKDLLNGIKELVQSVCDSFSEEFYGYDSENDYYAGFDDGLKRAIRLMIAKVRDSNGRVP